LLVKDGSTRETVKKLRKLYFSQLLLSLLYSPLTIIANAIDDDLMHASHEMVCEISRVKDENENDLKTA